MVAGAEVADVGGLEVADLGAAFALRETCGRVVLRVLPPVVQQQQHTGGGEYHGKDDEGHVRNGSAHIKDAGRALHL